MSSLHYQIWHHPQNWPGMTIAATGAVLKKTGTIAASAGISNAVASVDPSSSNSLDVVAHFKVVGSKAVYVEIVRGEDPAPASTGVHVAEDAKLRVLLEASDGVQKVPLPRGARFAVVEAAAVL